ncbi:MAG: 50S ribosomal protein L23 [Legionellales bacterium]|nr:50S ribosomal protein L23 [Legionellales bacterium]
MNQEKLMNIIIAPVSSEKSNNQAEKDRQFVFRVRKDATKPQIGAAIAMLFKVEVSSVKVLNVKSEQKRHGKTQGVRSGWKKAYVSLKEGYDIDFARAE